LRRDGLAGTPAEVVDRIGAYVKAGAQRIYLQCLDVDDVAHVELIAAQVAPQLG
jgi:2-methylisocitrate lyase-like PEP mutase family enzyme